LRSIKFCKGIDYFEWVISLMSERASLRAESTLRVTQTSKSVVRLVELRREVEAVAPRAG
jgi:hypothetical protein